MSNNEEYSYELNPHGDDHDDWLIFKMIDGQQDYVGAACTKTLAELYCAAPDLLDTLYDIIIKADRQRLQLSALSVIHPDLAPIKTAITENTLILNAAKAAIAKATGQK